jgi:hypothetical protein
MAAQIIRYDAQFEEFMLRVIVGVYAEVDARIEESMKEFVFRGSWTDGRKYKKRNLVSLGGAVFYCNVESTDMRPGVSPDWALLVPKAKDGRDGRDAGEPPEPRTVRSERSSSPDLITRRR